MVREGCWDGGEVTYNIVNVILQTKNSQFSNFRDREIYSEELRSIEVPIISIAECQRAYHNVAGLTSKDICTYYEGRQKCCHDGDSGSPLVVRGHLVGVMSWSGEDHNPHYPDVFVNLVDIENRNWVLSNLEHITRWH